MSGLGSREGLYPAGSAAPRPRKRPRMSRAWVIALVALLLISSVAVLPIACWEEKD